MTFSIQKVVDLIVAPRLGNLALEPLQPFRDLDRLVVA